LEATEELKEQHFIKNNSQFFFHSKFTVRIRTVYNQQQ